MLSVINHSTRLASIGVLLCLFTACGSKHFVAPPPLPADDRSISEPAEYELHPYAEFYEWHVDHQMEQMFDFSRGLRILFGQRKEAMNLNAFDEVDNSSWFNNRNHLYPMTADAVGRGPDLGDGPNTDGTWTIIFAKNQGVTPGFGIKDADGDLYLIKFDPRGYQELASGAEVVSTKLFYAMGFNTPENYITHFDPAILQLGEKVKFTDAKGTKRLMVQEDIDDILKRVERQPNGKIRALASKFISGTPLGPFRYKGTRDDDPNDIIPHQHRRELRGLRIIAAWLSHFDTKDGNSLDMFVEEDGRSYVRHYMIDFGATLGSASWGPKRIWRGHENDIDPGLMIGNLVSGGFNVRGWETLDTTVVFPSIGRYESSTFRPHKFKPQMPNPAFEELTDRDAYWATKLITAFTDGQLAAAVEAGQYSDPQASAYLLKTLKERRDIIGRHYFEKVTSLDYFRIEKTNIPSYQLHFTDLAIRSGFANNRETQYRVNIFSNGRQIQPPTEFGSKPPLDIDATIWDSVEAHNDVQQIEVRLQLRRNSSAAWQKAVKVYLNKSDGGVTIAGIKR